MEIEQSYVIIGYFQTVFLNSYSSFNQPVDWDYWNQLMHGIYNLASYDLIEKGKYSVRDKNNGIKYKFIKFETDMDNDDVKKYVMSKVDPYIIHNGNIYALNIRFKTTISIDYGLKELLEYISVFPNMEIYYQKLNTVIDELNNYLKECNMDIVLQLGTDLSADFIDETDCYHIDEDEDEYEDNNQRGYIGIIEKGELIGQMIFQIDRFNKYIHLENSCIGKLNRGRSLSVLSRLPLILFAYGNPDLIDLIGSQTVQKKGTNIFASRSLLHKYFGFYTHYPKNYISTIASRTISHSIISAIDHIENRVYAGAGVGAGVTTPVITNMEQDSDKVENESKFVNMHYQDDAYAKKIKEYLMENKLFEVYNMNEYHANTFLLIKDMNTKYLTKTLDSFKNCNKPQLRG